MERKSFLDQEAPAGYIAGLGRGATGFSTQADLGSARLPPGSFAPDNDDEDEDDERFLDADNDEFDGFVRDGITGAEAEEAEADRIYEEIENKMKLKRSKKRKATNESDSNDKDLVKDKTTDTTGKKVQVSDITIEESIDDISSQFKDLKNNLSTINEEEWLNLPESGDFTKLNKRQRKLNQEQQRSYAVPDSILSNASGEEMTNLKTISSARDKLLKIQLDSDLGGSSGNSIEVDQYLRKLEGDEITSTDIGDSNVEVPMVFNNIGDIKKTRLALTSMRKSNPYKPQGWIASSRLEEHAQRLNVARRLIQEGCDMCPRSQEIWLENIRLNYKDTTLCKSIIAEGIKYNSNSVTLWLKAVELEKDLISKKRVLKKALEYIPDSVELWESLIEFETSDSSKIKMLSKATELIPQAIDLWLNLVTLVSRVDFEESKTVLNDARKSVKPEDKYLIWIYGARLEERATENEMKVNRIIKKCIIDNQSEKDGSGIIDRYEWLRQAVICENEGFRMTCRSIILNSIQYIQTDDEFDADSLKIDALQAFDNGNFEVSRALFLALAKKLPKDLNIWNEYINIERQIGDLEELYLIYELSIETNPGCIDFYKRYAIDKYDNSNGDMESFKMIIDQGIANNPEDEELRLLLVDQYVKLDQIDDTVMNLFEDMIKHSKCSIRVYYKYVTILRKLERYERAIEIIDAGLSLFSSNSYKLILQKGQIYYTDLKNIDKAQDAYEQGIKLCRNCALIWIELSRLFEFDKRIIIKSRSILDQGLSFNPQSDTLWLERVLLEKRSDNLYQYNLLLSQGIKRFPKSGILWSEYISIDGNTRSISSSKRKNLYVDALRASEDNDLVVFTIAKNLWKEGKLPKSKAFFDKCLSSATGKLVGDYYISYLGFLFKHGDPKEIDELIEKFVSNKPKYGDAWTKLTKDIKNLNQDPLKLLRSEASKLVQ